MKTTLDRFGRIVLPKRVREGLGLHPGSVLKIEERYQEILLRSVEEEPPLQVKEGVLVYRGEAAGDLEAGLRTHREDRIKRLSPRKKT